MNASEQQSGVLSYVASRYISGLVKKGGEHVSDLCSALSFSAAPAFRVKSAPVDCIASLADLHAGPHLRG
jgi:hypothetical protein